MLIRVIQRHCTTEEEVTPAIDNSSQRNLTRNPKFEKEPQIDSLTSRQLNESREAPQSTFSTAFKKKIPFAAQRANMNLQAFKNQKGAKKSEKEEISSLKREVSFLRKENSFYKLKEMISRSKINIEEIRGSSKKKLILSSCYVRL